MLEFTLSGGVVCYLIAAAALSLIVRCIAYSLRAMTKPWGTWKSSFWVAFRGFGDEPTMNDYWQAYILGFLEASIFPILIVSNHPEYVGAWLGLKTIPQWSKWTEHREVYNRFLIANALIIVGSYVLAKWFFVGI